MQLVLRRAVRKARDILLTAPGGLLAAVRALLNKSSSSLPGVASCERAVYTLLPMVSHSAAREAVLMTCWEPIAHPDAVRGGFGNEKCAAEGIQWFPI